MAGEAIYDDQGRPVPGGGVCRRDRAEARDDQASLVAEPVPALGPASARPSTWRSRMGRERPVRRRLF